MRLVSLPHSLILTQVVCEISRRSFTELFAQLGVQELIERGESFYNDLLPAVVRDLESESKAQLQVTSEEGDKPLVVVESDGAKCVFLDGDDKPPTIIQKQDGSFLYATTDLAALRMRLDGGYSRILYVVDHAQSWHFQQLFGIAQRAKWWNPEQVEVQHIPFGLILGADGPWLSQRIDVILTIGCNWHLLNCYFSIDLPSVAKLCSVQVER